jgi:hypothetical protein
MLKWMLAAGAAALAITAPVAAQKGGHGGGKEHGAGQQKAAHGGGGQKADHANRGGGQKAERAARGGGNDRAMRAPQRMERQKFVQRDDKQSRGKGQSQARHDDRGKGQAMKIDRGNGGNDKVRVVQNDRSNRVEIRDRGNDRDLRVARLDRRDDDFRFVPRWNDRGLVRGFDDGCPPGLAKKGNGCMPPGQAKKLVGTPLTAALGLSALGGPYRSWYRDNDDYMYRWDDDYIYRVDRDRGLIDAFFPYQNHDYYYYPVGMSYPMDYNYYNVPYQYQSYYPDGGDYWYRYGDGAIYQVNPGTGMIQGIAALLTGNPFAVGQPLPPAYSVYNVPFDYRDRYYDTADNWYRYNDGYIYRVDPTTQLITAVINAIV